MRLHRTTMALGMCVALLSLPAALSGQDAKVEYRAEDEHESYGEDQTEHEVRRSPEHRGVTQHRGELPDYQEKKSRPFHGAGKSDRSKYLVEQRPEDDTEKSLWNVAEGANGRPLNRRTAFTRTAGQLVQKPLDLEGFR